MDEAELHERIDGYDRASEVTGPVGTAAAGIVFVIVARRFVPTPELQWWALLMAVAVLAMAAGLVWRRRTMLALPGYVLAGVGWGVVPLFALDGGTVDDRTLWMALAFQFATTAGVLSGSNVDDRLARAVLGATWGVGSLSMFAVGRPILGIGALAFWYLVDRDLRNTRTMVAELLDLRTRAAAEARRAEHASLVDPMTGLLNRTGLERELGSRSGFGAAMFVDLDRFKDVNDQHGHHAGDRVLRAAARRLRHEFRDRDLVARLGGDEFVVVLDGAHDGRRLLDRAADVIRVLEEPVELDGDLVLCSASVGVAVIPGDVDVELDTILRESDHAMYSAKRTGRRRAVLFGEELRSELDERAALSAALRAAVRDGVLEVWGQPVIDVASSRVFGVELLARWPTRSGAFIPPSQFIPVAEEIGVSSEITRTMLRRAVALTQEWSGHPLLDGMIVGLNVSGHDLRGEWLADELAACLAGTPARAEQLVIEVTESTSLYLDAGVRRCLEALHDRGVVIALDDFGTGYSSISSLVDLPIDVVKFDRSLVSAVAPGSRRSEVLRAITGLAGALGRFVIAEGVETDEEAGNLAEMGFHFAQGYFFCPPMPLDALAGSEGLEALARYSGDSVRTRASQ